MLVFAILCLISVCMAFKTINECPAIDTKIDPPKDVHDLHPSHIEVIASIGDSITAGVAAENFEGAVVTEHDFKQYRGLSWLSGGDTDAFSIANYIKKYSPGLFGSSTGVRDLPLCVGTTFFCTDYGHDYSIDQLNAAIPSAISNSIEEQINYLIEYIGHDSPHAKKWKIVNIFLGTNDLSVSCDPEYGVFNYHNNIEKGIELLKQNVDNVLINLIGLAETEKIPGLTDKEPGYRKTFENDIDPQKFECLCCRLGVVGKMDIAFHVRMFNEILKSITKKYGSGSNTFAIAFQPFHLDISAIPPSAISNLDGYHPNVNAYKFFSKALWKSMFLDSKEKPKKLVYEDDVEIFCPTATSRISTA